MSPTIITREQARALGLKRYFSGIPCVHGHIDERWVLNNTCISCMRVRKSPDYVPHPKRAVRRAAIAAGKHKYWTGVPCQRGHVSYRLVCDHSCMKCNAEKQKRRAASPAGRRYYEDYIKRPRSVVLRRARDKRRYWKDPSKSRWSALARYWSNRDTILGLQKLSLMRNPVRAAKRKARKRGDAEAYKPRRRERRKILYALDPTKALHASSLRRTLVRGARGSHTIEEALAILRAQKYRCAYCRKNLRRVKRHRDHIVALSRGGTNDKTNIQWLCADCNQSKHAKDPIYFARERGLLL